MDQPAPRPSTPAPAQLVVAVCASLLALSISCAAPADEGADGADAVDLPVYPEAQIWTPDREAMPSEPTAFFIVPRATEADVLTWYHERLTAEGWTVAVEPTGAAALLLVDDEGCYAIVAATDRSDGAVELQLTRQADSSECDPSKLPPGAWDPGDGR